MRKILLVLSVVIALAAPVHAADRLACQLAGKVGPCPDNVDLKSGKTIALANLPAMDIGHIVAALVAGGNPINGTVIAASTRIETPTIGTSSGAQHALPSGTAALLAADSSLNADNLISGTVAAARMQTVGPGAGAIAAPSSITLDAQGRITAATPGVAAAPNPFFGNGAMGDVVLDGMATFPWADLSGSTYTLKKFPFWNTLTINSGVTLRTVAVVNDGSQDLVVNFGVLSGRVSITNNGTIDASGANAVGTAAGGGAFSSYAGIGFGSYGGDGRTTASNGADALSFTFPITPARGGNGGTGGAALAFTGGVGGTAANDSILTDTGSGGILPGIGSQFYGPAMLSGMVFSFQASNPGGSLNGWGPGPNYPVGGGAGGGGGAASGVNAHGGGGGEGGYPLIISTPTFTNSGAGAVNAKGGNGAAGATAGTGADRGGGGAGGGGGRVCAYGNIWAGTAPNVSGGSGGAGFNSGTAGASGSTGIVDWLMNTHP